jgi:threonine efflux protein
VADWSALVAIEAAWIAVLVLPGPNFVTVGHAAVTRSRRAGLAVAAGIGLGTTVWAVTALVGLAALLASAHWLYQGVKLAGAAYLVVYGIGMLRAARRAQPAIGNEPSETEPAAGSGRSSFWRGVAVDLGNPKAAVFFTSLFAVAAPAGAPRWFQALLVATVAGSAVLWYGAVAFAFALAPARRAYLRAQRAVTAAVGALLVALGARLATQE